MSIVKYLESIMRWKNAKSSPEYASHLLGRLQRGEVSKSICRNFIRNAYMEHRNFSVEPQDIAD